MMPSQIRELMNETPYYIHRAANGLPEASIKQVSELAAIETMAVALQHNCSPAKGVYQYYSSTANVFIHCCSPCL